MKDLHYKHVLRGPPWACTGYREIKKRSFDIVHNDSMTVLIHF